MKCSVVMVTFSAGLALLAQVVRTATEQELLHHSLKHQLTLAQVQELLNGILEQASLSAGGHRLVQLPVHGSSSVSSCTKEWDTLVASAVCAASGLTPSHGESLTHRLEIIMLKNHAILKSDDLLL